MIKFEKSKIAPRTRLKKDGGLHASPNYHPLGVLKKKSTREKNYHSSVRMQRGLQLIGASRKDDEITVVAEAGF